MKAATFLLFAGVLSLFPESETVLFRCAEPSSFSGPMVFYDNMSIAQCARRASADLRNNFHVMAKIKHSLWWPLTTAIEQSFAHNPLVQGNHDNRGPIKNVTNVKVAYDLCTIREIEVFMEKPIIIDLSVEVPRVMATVSASWCLEDLGMEPCAMKAVTDKLTIELRCEWSRAITPKITNVLLKKFNVGSIQLSAPISSNATSTITVSETSPIWQQFRNMVKYDVTRRGTSDNLLKQFCFNIFH